ncbi:MAG: hypothetical protein ACKPKO_09440 [Candidatus Fonsibacter sp.]
MNRQKTATYVTNRRSVTFHPQGGNKYHPTTGATLTSFLITGNEWLDPSTFRIMFDLVNDETVTPPNNDKLLYPLGGPWSFSSAGSELCRGRRRLKTSRTTRVAMKCFRY